MILGGRLPGKVESCRNRINAQDNGEYRYLWYLKTNLAEAKIYSSIAQLAERMTVNHDVAGSSPAGGAISKDYNKSCSLFCDCFRLVFVV